MNDLTKHFIAGAIVSSAVCVVVLLIMGTDKHATDWALGLAFFSAFAAGSVKELYDKYVRRTYADPADLAFTWMGASVPMIIWGVIQNFV